MCIYVHDTCRVRHEILASASNMHITASWSHTPLTRLTKVMTSHEVPVGYERLRLRHVELHRLLSQLRMPSGSARLDVT